MHQSFYPPKAGFEGDPLFELKGVEFRYPDGRIALDGIDLTISQRERVALVGHNGAGKTTLIKHLCGLYRPDRGEVRYKQQILSDGHLSKARMEIGILFQDPDDQLFCSTLYEDVAFGPMNQGLDREDADLRARHALTTVGLDSYLFKAPHHLSFGQKKRAALATVLSMRPEVLILDEPTGNLDSKQERLFWELFQDFPGTLILISHDLAFMYGICDRAIVLERGKIHHDFGMKELVSQREYMRTHGLDFTFRFSCCSNHAEGHGHTHSHDHSHSHSHSHLHAHAHSHLHDFAANSHSHDHEHPHSHAFLPFCALPSDELQGQSPAGKGGNGSELSSPSLGARSNGELSSSVRPSISQGELSCFDTSARADGDPISPLISLKNYSYRYPDSSWGLKDISFSVAEGESVAIVGENGAGKSTLARCLMGIIGGRGTYELAGEPVTPKNMGLLWRQIGMVFQDPADQLFSPSCREEVAFGPKQMGLSREEARQRVQEALEAVELSGFEDRVPHHLSAGERKRLAIASVLSMKPRVLILDEPTVHLDPRSEELVLNILQRLDITKILISHDMPLILALCRRTMVLHQGRMIRDYLSVDLQRDEHLISINGLDYTYKNDCCREIMALQEDFEARATLPLPDALTG